MSMSTTTPEAPAATASRGDSAAHIVCQRSLPKPRVSRRQFPDHPGRKLSTAMQLGVVCLIALVLRYYRLDNTWLWYDEIFGATFAAQSLFDATIAAVRFDIHPPVWVQQLQIWSQAGLSDTWLLSNSICWSIVAIVSLFVASRRILWTARRLDGRGATGRDACLRRLRPTVADVFDGHGDDDLGLGLE